VRRLLIAGAALGLLAGCGTSATTSAASAPTSSTSSTSSTSTTPSPSSPVPAPSPTAPPPSSTPDPSTAPPAPVVTSAPDPRAVSIPALAVSSSLVPLGLTASGEHEVPPLAAPEQAGWFTGGPEPGEIGAAIILGHVNGNGQDGVFADLDRLKAGDDVVVDGATYEVYEVIRAPKNAFPADRVYGDTAAPELRLITCGGAFDRSRGSYEENVVVFAAAR